jgi:hypothetical protein
MYSTLSKAVQLTSVSNTGDTSSNDELRRSTTARRNSSDLDNDTNDHNNSTEEDGLATTKTVTKVENEESTEEATDSVDGDHEAFVCLIKNLGEIVCESGS